MGGRDGRSERAGRVMRVVPRVLFGLVVALEVLMMVNAGAAKFVRADWWGPAFAGWGYPPGTSAVVGAAEVGFALALLVPRVRIPAAAGLALIMVVALGTVVLHPGALGPDGPLVHLAFLAVIAGVEIRRRRGGPAGPQTSAT